MHAARPSNTASIWPWHAATASSASISSYPLAAARASPSRMRRTASGTSSGSQGPGERSGAMTRRQRRRAAPDESASCSARRVASSSASRQVTTSRRWGPESWSVHRARIRRWTSGDVWVTQSRRRTSTSWEAKPRRRASVSRGDCGLAAARRATSWWRSLTSVSQGSGGSGLRSAARDASKVDGSARRRERALRSARCRPALSTGANRSMRARTSSSWSFRHAAWSR